MRVSGIVVEYNPLHNGHIYHLNHTRKITRCDGIVAVMSGNFVQRGEPAFLNKWARTKMALKAGVDLVLELPVIYSISSAEGFAFGAVSTLDSLGLIDSICFGSEAGDIELLYNISNILYTEPKEYKEFLQSYLKSGLSFPLSREKALFDYFKFLNYSKEHLNCINEVMRNSNNILALEYIKSLMLLSSKIKPYTIKRAGNRYNDTKITGTLSSASSIRKNFNNPEIDQALPIFSKDIISQEMVYKRCPVTINDFSDIILHRLREMDLDEIGQLLDVSEGLENKIKRASEDSGNIDKLLESVVSKRYPASRIKRILIYSLLGIKNDVKHMIKTPVKYIRVLGFNEKGKEILKNIKKTSILPIITNPSKDDITLLKYDIAATDIYVLGYKESQYKIAKQDLKTPPIIL